MEPVGTELAGISDDELTALALASDPSAADVVAAGAVSIWDVIGTDPHRSLPEWYMPTPVGPSRIRRGWRRTLALVVIAAFLTIDAYGLCSTYGQIVFA